MRRLTVIIALSVAITSPCVAQVRASELATMTQIIDGTKLSLQYSRPRLRGRTDIFGTKYAQWDEVWTPGANTATTLETNRDVSLNGHTLRQGKYSVWFVLKPTGDWIAVFDPRSTLYHEDHPDSTAQQLRFPVHVEAAPLTDVLTWTMPELHMTGGTLSMQWERQRVTMAVEVAPSLVTTMSESDAAPYLGTYDYVERDTVTNKTTMSTLRVLYENGTLKGEWTPADPYFKRFALIRIAPDWFAPGIYDKTGVIYEVLRPDMTFEFTRTNARPMAFEVRGEGDELFGTGKRKN